MEADGYARQLVKYIHLKPVRPKDKRTPIPVKLRMADEMFQPSSETLMLLADVEHQGRRTAGCGGDVRVNSRGYGILVTSYNAPNQELLRAHYQGFPDKLAAEHIDPRVPWLYGFKLDFRFK